MGIKTRKVVWGTRKGKPRTYFVAQYSLDGQLEVLCETEQETSAELLAYALAAYRGQVDDHRFPAHRDGAL